jgi:hypothetical protein
MIFKKYEFASEAEWLTTKDSLHDEGLLTAEVAAIHEIGFICLATDAEGECTELSTKYAVDILLNEDVEWIETFAVYPNPCGIHSFAGCEGLYLESYCLQNPESPYCTLPDENIF